MFAISLVLAIAVGVVTPVQSATNAALSRAIGQLQASATSFGGGLAIVLVVMVLFGAGDVTCALECPAWQLVGGLYGLAFVISAIVCTPVLGVALCTAASMLGQLAMGLAIDSLGLFGTARIPLSPLRVAGVAAATVGIALVYLGSSSPGGRSQPTDGRAPSLPHLVAAILGGCLATIQSPTNAALAQTVGQVEASAISFAVGFLGAVILVLVVWRSRMRLEGSVRHASSDQAGELRPWYLTGGVYGAFGVTSAIYAMPWLGAGLYMAALMLGQLVGGMAIDSLGVLEMPRRSVNAWRIAGAACVGGGIVLVTLARVLG